MIMKNTTKCKTQPNAQPNAKHNQMHNPAVHTAHDLQTLRRLSIRRLAIRLQTKH